MGSRSIAHAPCWRGIHARRAAAAAARQPLWQALAAGRKVALPVPQIQIFGGGAHALERELAVGREAVEEVLGVEDHGVDLPAHEG